VRLERGKDAQMRDPRVPGTGIAVEHFSCSWWVVRDVTPRRAGRFTVGSLRV